MYVAQLQYSISSDYLHQHNDFNKNSSNKFLFIFQLITRLENETHKMEVQWNEAEHIRKKYRAIKNSLMMDSEKFEST